MKAPSISHETILIEPVFSATPAQVFNARRQPVTNEIHSVSLSSVELNAEPKGAQYKIHRANCLFKQYR